MCVHETSTYITVMATALPNVLPCAYVYQKCPGEWFISNTWVNRLSGDLDRLSDLLYSLLLFYLCTSSVDEAGYVVVGVSSLVITERESSTAPSDQLADAQHYVSTKKPNEFTFTYDVSFQVLCSFAKDGPWAVSICVQQTFNSCVTSWAHLGGGHGVIVVLLLCIGHTWLLHYAGIVQGSYIISFSGKKLLVCDLENENKYRLVYQLWFRLMHVHNSAYADCAITLLLLLYYVAIVVLTPSPLWTATLWSHALPLETLVERYNSGMWTLH